MKDAIKGYLALAAGLSELTRQRAMTAARALVAQGEATAGQVTQLTDDLIAQSRANREAMTALVRAEVDRALARVGLAGADQVAVLSERIDELENGLRETTRRVNAPPAVAARRAAPGRVPAPTDGTQAAMAAARRTMATPVPVGRAAPSGAGAKKAAASPGRTTPTQKAAGPSKPAAKAPRKRAPNPP